MKTASENIRDIDDLHHTLCCQRHQDHTCGAGLELCWTCRLALLASMRTLAANLRDAGALCATEQAAWKDGAWAMIEVLIRRKSHYELYRHGEIMRTHPATFAILDELSVFMRAERLRGPRPNTTGRAVPNWRK